MNDKEIIAVAQKSFEDTFGILQDHLFEVQDGEIFMFVNDEGFYESNEFSTWSAKLFKNFLMPNESAINFAFDSGKFAVKTEDVNFVNIYTSAITAFTCEDNMFFLSPDDLLNKTIYSFATTDEIKFFDFGKVYKAAEVDCKENYNMAA